MTKPKILVVEDEVIVGEDIRRTLQNMGYEVPTTASSGKEAIKKVNEINPDLVMMDINLRGEMDGIETAEEIHSRFNIPVIYLTAFSDEKTLERAKKTEPFGYIVKPFKDRELSIAIDIALFKQEIEKKLKENREWFITTLKSINDGVIATDSKDCVKFMNPVAQSLTGWRLEEARSKPLSEIFINLPESYEGIKNQAILIARNKKQIPIDISSAPIKNENGDTLGSVMVFRDITGQKIAGEMHLEKERLVYANKAKSEFLANMSHELRTPLNAIIGFSELLKMKNAGDLNEKQEHYVNNVLSGSKHLLNLINGILDLSKIEAGKMELAVESIPVSGIINETINLIKEKAAKHNIILKKDIDAQLEFIEADPQRFKQILFNLLSNAVKFSKNEGGIVTITAKKEGDMVKISVSDTGIGIKEEDIERLFKSFEQLDSGSSRGYEGTGLGLAITKNLVELHGGSIKAESRYGEGSTFTFFLPPEAKKKEETKC